MDLEQLPHYDRMLTIALLGTSKSPRDLPSEPRILAAFHGKFAVRSILSVGFSTLFIGIAWNDHALLVEHWQDREF
jgi:hypothetical protein